MKELGEGGGEVEGIAPNPDTDDAKSKCNVYTHFEKNDCLISLPTHTPTGAHS